MAQVTITQLPQAGALDGTELVPIVQNGVTVHTTTADIAIQPTQQQTFVTVDQESTLPNSRYMAIDTGLSLSDGGANSFLKISMTGAAASLNAASGGIIVKDSPTTVASRSIAVGSGLSITNADGTGGNPIVGLDGIVGSIENIGSGNGFFALNGTTALLRQIYGTSDQIDVTNGNGSGNPVIGISANAIFPGSGAVTIPNGTNAQRPSGVSGQIRYNTETQRFEVYTTEWQQIGLGDGTVTSVNASGGTTGMSFTGGPITTSGTLTLTGVPTFASNIDGGAANEIPYQSGTGSTSFVSAPSLPDTFLKWDGSSFLFDALPGGGTVTSVNASGGTTGLTFSGGPITSSGTLTLAGTLAVANGGRSEEHTSELQSH